MSTTDTATINRLYVAVTEGETDRAWHREDGSAGIVIEHQGMTYTWTLTTDWIWRVSSVSTSDGLPCETAIEVTDEGLTEELEGLDAWFALGR